MIISASRRTDIPSCYPEWFANRVSEGFVYVRNPMNARQVSKIDLSIDLVDCIVFWTKNPAPILPYLSTFEDYPYYFHVTLTGYGRDVEPGIARKREGVIPAIKELSERIGAERVIWRYDPILFNDKYTPSYHLRAIDSISRELEGFTRSCVISFVDTYPANRSALSRIGHVAPSESDLRIFASSLAGIVEARGMDVSTCAERIDMGECGIRHGRCIDPDLVERMTGRRLSVGKDPSQRPACGCAASIDIGSYGTCANGCAYCYACRGARPAALRHATHDPRSPLLCDELGPGDIVSDRPMRSLSSGQMELDI
ncbi:MAG: DUF1848 domain-containing protein [Collinsella sp.]|nr:DUF1848 domain-containing protein [Collinsella sp.]